MPMPAAITTAVGVSRTPDGRRTLVSASGRIALLEGEGLRWLTDGSALDAGPVFDATQTAVFFVRRTRDPRLGPRDPRVMRVDLLTGEERRVGPGIGVACPR